MNSHSIRRGLTAAVVGVALSACGGSAPKPEVQASEAPAVEPMPAPAPVVEAAPKVEPKPAEPVIPEPPEMPEAPVPEPVIEPPAAVDGPCSYKTYAWDTRKKKGVGHREVSKLRSELAADEKDPDDPRCSVCREDQVQLALEGLPKVTVCKHYATELTAALEAIVASGTFQVRTLKGYRVGRTRGAIRDGLRSQFSNHSYGTAIDINAPENGLYRRCRLGASPTKAKDIKHCKLGVGGAWDPKRRPKQTITKDGVVYAEFTKFWKWGGDLPGQLKDFMHFSLTGE